MESIDLKILFFLIMKNLIRFIDSSFGIGGKFKKTERILFCEMSCNDEWSEQVYQKSNYPEIFPMTLLIVCEMEWPSSRLSLIFLEIFTDRAGFVRFHVIVKRFVQH